MLGRLLVASAKVTVVVVAVVECCGGGDCGNDGGGGGGGCTSVFELKSFHPVMPRIHTRNAGERANERTCARACLYFGLCGHLAAAAAAAATTATDSQQQQRILTCT